MVNALASLGALIGTRRTGPPRRLAKLCRRKARSVTARPRYSSPGDVAVLVEKRPRRSFRSALDDAVECITDDGASSGARVVALAGSETKLAHARALGAYPVENSCAP